MTMKPRVLIFDDKKDLANDYALSISNHYQGCPVNGADKWYKYIGAPYWCAIVVDVQLIGQKKDGLAYAKEAILEHGLTTPIIIISGVVSLGEIKENYNSIFFDYIPHDNYNDKLLLTIDRACDKETRHKHVVDMLTVFTQQKDLLDYKLRSTDINEFTDSDRSTKVGEIFGSMKDQTLREIIETGISEEIDVQNHVGKLLFHIIRKEYS